MNWGKASNILVVCLLILNSVLFYMINQNNSRYQLSGKQEAAIIRLLSKNKINISYTKIPKYFEPMREIQMDTTPYDPEAIKVAFLGTDSDIRRTVEFNKTKYTKQGFSLTISDTVIVYADTDVTFESFTLDTVKNQAADFATKLSNIFPSFVFDTAVKNDDSITVRYSNTYKKNTIYSNYMSYEASAYGGVTVTCCYSTPKGFYGDKKQICPPDEALLTFMYELRRSYAWADTLFVDKIDLVYYHEEVARATPYYRIYVKDMPEPFLVNAYTNLLI